MTRLIFLGTKGEIEESSPRHQYHSSLLIVTDETRLLIDYGQLHRFSLEELKPRAILITHAHPDHYVWLKEDIKTVAPVYLTRESYEYGRFVPSNSQIITPGERFETGPFQCLAYEVIHSIRCPAVGYKIKVEQKTIIYNPDLVDIVDKDNVLREVDYYIGDGSAIRANLVRRRGEKLFGHTRITTQVNWCKKYGINNIIFTHLGKETIANEDKFSQENVEATLAYDGMELVI
jgi:phosphoribosyl 1,2-cyclic phosphodiesterase